MNKKYKTLDKDDVLQIGDIIYACIKDGVECSAFALDRTTRWFSYGDTLASAKEKYDNLPGPWKMTGAARVTKRVSRKEYKRRIMRVLEYMERDVFCGPCLSHDEGETVCKILRGEE